MVRSIRIGVCLMAVYGVVSSWSFERPGKDLHDNDKLLGSPNQERVKRANPLLLGAVALGKWARNFLVNGATKAPQKQPLQLEHIKDGGYLHAIQDFYSVRPTGVEYFQDKKTGMFGKIGHVGDRTLQLQGKLVNGKAENPTLKIIKTKEFGNPESMYDVITYRHSGHI